MERAYRHLDVFVLALVPLFIAGFWIPYLRDIPHFAPEITAAVHVHALLLFAWLFLLVVQPLLIRFRALSLHRSAGRSSYLLVALIVPFAIAMLCKEYQEHLEAGATPSAARNAEWLSAAQLLAVTVAYVLAIINIRRRNAGAHMRWMICIAIFLMPAALTRLLGYWFDVRQMTGATVSLVTVEVCLVALILYDRRRALNPRPYISGLLLYNAGALIWIGLGRPV